MIQRPCNTHFVKILPRWYEDVLEGKKKFELRKDDRGYEVGDIIVLQEWDEEYTGREIQKEIEYILRGVEGLKDGYCILGCKDGKQIRRKR